MLLPCRCSHLPRRFSAGSLHPRLAPTVAQADLLPEWNVAPTVLCWPDLSSHDRQSGSLALPQGGP